MTLAFLSSINVLDFPLMDFPIWLIPCDACSGVAKWNDGRFDVQRVGSMQLLMGVCSGDVLYPFS